MSGLLLAAASSTNAAPQPRVTSLYTTWDDYYFYAGFQVSDPDVSGENTTPTSMPQQDDDIEIFFETDKARAHTRTENTYQMAVSAAGGAYFSVGDGTAIPKPKVVYTYKYAAGVEGTLNDNTDRDRGYTIEVAIPWQELGQSGPPADGSTWGFNVISRNRHDTAKPATSFVSLSSDVHTAADVQDPSKWATILFDAGQKTRPKSSAAIVVSPQVTQHFPSINGSIVSGEWPAISVLSFGADAVDAPAPTLAQEPNTSDSPFSTPPPEPVNPEPTPEPPHPNGGVPVVKEPGGGDSIPLPGGGAIKIVPGGIKTPAGFDPTDAGGPGTGQHRNPLAPKSPAGLNPSGPKVALSGNLALGTPTPATLLMAVYRIDYNGDGRKGAAQNVWKTDGKTALVDQPVDGTGPWFSALRTEWHVRQFTEMRQAGIDVALVRASSHDPLLNRELDAMVSALKQLAAQKRDYPLIGVDVSGADSPTAHQILSRIPAQFLARQTSEVDQPMARAIAFSGGRTVEAAAKLADGSQIAILPTSPELAVLTPGGYVADGLVDRDTGRKYTQDWQSALSGGARSIVLDSWNDFTRGTEIAPSRQYGEYFSDQTRLQTIRLHGNRQWHALYLSEQAPRIVQAKTLYQVPVRIENAGTLPWRAGEMYSLCVRWYKDGRLYDDKASRIPIGRDILPGQSATIGVGLVALNSYGTDIEPGEYTLVFDMIQGNDRWFSYAGDSPLQIPVTVVPAGAEVAARGVFLGSSTPTTAVSGTSVATTVHVRNDGSQPWTDDRKLYYKLQTLDSATGALKMVAESTGVPLGPSPVARDSTVVANSGAAIAGHGQVPAGQVADVETVVKLATADGSPLPEGHYRIHWYLKGASDTTPIGACDEEIDAVSEAIAPSFVLSDISRTAGASKPTTAKLAVANMGSDTWRKTDISVGYHWYYMDGTEAAWDGGVTPLTKDVAPQRADGNIVGKFLPPKNPGRYMLVWDVRTKDGKWASTSQLPDGQQILPALITVTGNGNATTVDLANAANAKSIALSGDTSADFDGQGGAFPDEMLPPDAAHEYGLNPLFQPRAAAPLFPGSYYGGDDADHSAPFLYPARKRAPHDTVACNGQRIGIPGGQYRSIRILAASSEASGTTGKFVVTDGNRTAASQDCAVSGWLTAPEHAGVFSPYHRVKGVATDGACYFGVYEIALPAGQHADGLTLPEAPGIKILAITAVK